MQRDESELCLASILTRTGFCSDLGVHVDGYVALVATTIVVGQTEITGKAADAIMAAKTAADVIIRCLKDGGHAFLHS